MDKNKLNKFTRKVQKSAARMDAALSRSEQEENNRLLALRTEERKAARKGMAVDDIIKNGTPEEKAEIVARDFDYLRQTEKGCITLEEKKAVYFSFDDDTIEGQEEHAVFLNYLKLYTDLGDYTDRTMLVYNMYQVEVALLSKLIDKYEAIDRDLMFYEILYGSLVGTKGHSDMKYNLHDNDKAKMKRLDDTTPEALLAEFNDIHKNDGVVFKDPKQDGTLVTDIDFKGGLYGQIKEQGERCAVKLSYLKSYIEPIVDYLDKNRYWAFAPLRLTATIKEIYMEDFSKGIIASKFHLRNLKEKLHKGEAVTEKEKKMAVVPDYYRVKPDEEVKNSCIDYIKRRRNEPPKLN